MKLKAAFLIAYSLLFVATASAQQRLASYNLNSSNQTSSRIDLTGTGISGYSFTWNTTGTVSAGACALQGGSDGTTYGTTIIAAQTVTSSGGPTAVVSGTVYNYVRFNCTTPIVGSGAVKITFLGWIPNPDGGTFTLVQPVEVDIFSSSHANIEPATDPCWGQEISKFTTHVTSITATVLAAASPTFRTFICGVWIFVSAAHNVAIVEDNDSGCGSPTGLFGGATAATGFNITANGIAVQRGGSMVQVTSADNLTVCMLTAATTPTTVLFTYVYAE